MAIKSEPLGLCSWNFWNFLFSMRLSNGECFKDFKIFDLTCIWRIWLEWPFTLFRSHRHSIFELFNGIWLLRFRPSPLPLLTTNQNLLKNSCLQQCSPLQQTPFLFVRHDYNYLLQVCFRCAHPKNTPPQCLKNYMQSPKYVWWRTIDFIFNQWNVFSGIVDQTFCFDYIYNQSKYVLFVWNREYDKKGIRSGGERRKTKNEAATSFWWHCKAWYQILLYL